MSAVKDSSKLADEVLSRQALHELNAIYCQAVDRCDADMLASLYHPDAIVDFGAPMPASEWVPLIIDVELSLARAFHSVSTEWFDIRGDKAIGERYLYAVTTQERDGGSSESFLGARYVGGYERRDGVWKFTFHALIIDCNANYPTDQFWAAADYDAAGERGRHTPDDPVEQVSFAYALPVIVPTEQDGAVLHEIADKQAIDQVIAAHSRGLDNADAALLKSCYHPDGVVEYGMFEGAASDFADAVTQNDGLPATQHRPSAVWSVVDGDRAKAETSVIVYREDQGDNGTLQQFVCGRYLDTLEKRDGAWKILKRIYVLDWNSNMPDTSDWDEPLYEPIPRGEKGGDDAGYRLLAQWARETKAAAPRQGGKGTPDLAVHTITKRALRDVGLAYCRAVDRGDEDLLASLFTEGARISAGDYDGDVAGFAASQVTGKPGLIRSFHSISTDYYEIDGDQALGTTYVIRFDTAIKGGEERDTLQGGRFLDRFEREGGVWKIAERRYVIEWILDLPGTGMWDKGIYAQLPLHGTRGPDDPVYKFWAG